MRIKKSLPRRPSELEIGTSHRYKRPMKSLPLPALLSISLALFATACGSSGTPEAGGTPPAANPGATTQNPGGAPNTPAAPSTPGHSGIAGCNTHPGCGVSNGGGSCTVGAQTCVDYTGGNEQARAQFQASCEHNNHGHNHGVYSATACSMTNLAGSCKTEGGTGGEAIVRFYAVGHMSTDVVQQACVDPKTCAVFCAP